MAQQQPESVADEVRCRLEAGGEQQHHRGDELGLGEPVTRLLGGDTLVQSEPGVGSTFTLSLPEEVTPGALHAAPPLRADRMAEFESLVRRELEIIGEDPLNIEKIWETIFRKTFWGMGGGTVVNAAICASAMLVPAMSTWPVSTASEPSGFSRTVAPVGCSPPSQPPSPRPTPRRLPGGEETLAREGGAHPFPGDG